MGKRDHTIFQFTISFFFIYVVKKQRENNLQRYVSGISIINPGADQHIPEYILAHRQAACVPSNPGRVLPLCWVIHTVRAKKIFTVGLGRPLTAANRRLPTPSGNGGERQTPVIFTPRAVLDPMLQTMMDPGTSLPVIPLHESQITAARLTGGNSFRSLHMYALCTLYTGRIK